MVGTPGVDRLARAEVAPPHGHRRHAGRVPGLHVAQVVADVILSSSADPKAALLAFMRKLSGNPAVDFDPEVAQSEKDTGHRNAALVHFMKSQGNITNDVERVLDFYYHQCSLTMSCVDLSRAILFLANKGISPIDGERVVTERQAKRINSLMLLCGLYDAGGNFAYRVGIPGKSGVGGGIVGNIPGELGVCVWSPELDATGSSLVGVQALELFTTKLGNSIF